MIETQKPLDQETFPQLEELVELVNRVLKLGRELRIVLAEQLITQEEEAAWSGLMVIEQNIQDNLYLGDQKRIAEELELAQEYLGIVFPRLDKIQDELGRAISSLRHYSDGLTTEEPLR